jgi:hypothetical protein
MSLAVWPQERPGGGRVEILKDTVGGLWFIQYGLVIFGFIGLVFLCVAMRPDISYFTGRSGRLRVRGKEDRAKETGE